MMIRAVSVLASVPQFKVDVRAAVGAFVPLVQANTSMSAVARLCEADAEPERPCSKTGSEGDLARCGGSRQEHDCAEKKDDCDS